MDRKQQLGMWFLFLVSFSLGTTAKAECSAEWLGLKVKLHTKMGEGISEWCCARPLCLPSGTSSPSLFLNIYLKGRAIDREIFHLLVCSPNGHNEVWNRPKPGASNSILVFHMGGRGASTWAIFPCLPRRISRKLVEKCMIAWTGTGTLKRDASPARHGLTHCATTLAS